MLIVIGPTARGSLQAAATTPATVTAPAITTPGAFSTLAPARLLDTRIGLGAGVPGPGGTISFPVLGRGGVPATGVSAVVLNLTAVTPTASGYLTVWSGDGAAPNASNLNFSAGQIVPNLVVAPVGADGRVSVYNSAGTTQVLADVQGYYLSGTVEAAGTFNPLPPTRVMDTRAGLGASALGPGATARLQILGAAGGAIPASGVATVVLNVTVTAPSASGFLTVWSGVGTPPAASNLNFSKGKTVANLVYAPVGADGHIAFYNSGGTSQVIADIEGYFLAGAQTSPGTYQGLPAPKRVLDTRTGLGGKAPAADGVVRLAVLGKAGVPTAAVSAIVVNVAVTQPQAGGHVTVYSGDSIVPPSVSNLNFVAGQTVPNLVIAPVGADGEIALHNGSSGTVQLVADIAGYYLGSPPAVTNLNAAPSTTSVNLSWTNPGAAAVTGITIRVSPGAVAPSSPSAGMPVTDTSATSFTHSGLTPGTQYTYALFSHDANGNYSIAATRTVTTLVNDSAPGPILQPTAANVTADALPTTQMNGVAWTQVIIGNTVYVGGSFSKARPYGSALGSNEVARSNILAYDLKTGVLVDSFAPVFDGQIMALAASPDGATLYAGGDFTHVNGASHSRIVALSPSTGQPIASFKAATNAQVRALATTAAAVYAGGVFTTANGVAHNRAAAFLAGSGAVTAWAPNADSTVNALLITPDGSKVVLGGRFLNLNGQKVYGSGAVNATTGASKPWVINGLVRNYGTGAAITSLATDGASVFGTGYVFYANGTGNFEGVFSADPANGALNWIEDCHGDTYSVAPVNGIVYTASHAHFCANDGGWPVYNPWQFRRTMAFTAQATGKLLANSQPGYFNYQGTRAPSMINWFPDFLTGTYTGQGQAVWSVAGTSQYIVEGGEFPAVNNKPQQGLVRFAVSSIAPHLEKPRVGASNLPADFVPTLASPDHTTVNVSFAANWDRDDQTLYYSVVRDGNTAQPIWTGTADSQWWNRPTLGFTDSGLVPGSTHSYQITAKDGHGNTTTGAAVSITLSS